MSFDKRKALVAGGTGLVGGKLVDMLAEDEGYEKILLLTRRPFTCKNPKVEVVQVDFDHLNETAPALSAHDYFCCLGAGSQSGRDVFRRVDYDYVLALARLAEADVLCQQFLLLTSIGANPSSGIYYNKIKGEVEREVGKLDIPGIHIFRPSLILGKRKRRRGWEEAGKVFSAMVSFFMVGTGRQFLAIEDRQVAQAMHLVAQRHLRGTRVYSPKAMYRMCVAREMPVRSPS